MTALRKPQFSVLMSTLTSFHCSACENAAVYFEKKQNKEREKNKTTQHVIIFILGLKKDQLYSILICIISNFDRRKILSKGKTE